MSKKKPYVEDPLEIAKELVAKWQKILYLQPWNIVVDTASRDDMETDGQAEVSLNNYCRNALVRILSPKEFRKSMNGWDQYFKRDIERSVVHELLHIKMDEFVGQVDGKDEMLYERFVDNMAKILVGMERSGHDGRKQGKS
jgi:hypothetical protein